MPSEWAKALPDSGIIIPGSSDFIRYNNIDFSGLPGTIEYMRFPLARPAATGGLFTPSFLTSFSFTERYNPVVSADTTGLYLSVNEKDVRKLGVNKPPVAAGRASGNLMYSIVPGKPEKSILLYRMKSEDPGIMMPESGRALAHSEGIRLIESWIKNYDK